MQDYYQARYKTGKRSIIVSGSLFFFFILLALIGTVGDSSGLQGLGVVCAIFFAGFGMISLKGYREMLLYDDRLEVVTLFGGMEYCIYFRDIKHLGFLKGHTDSVRRGLVQDTVSSEGVSELVILMQDTGRYQFSDDEYDDLPAICTFIRERTDL